MKNKRTALFLLVIFVLGGVGYYFKSCQDSTTTQTEEAALKKSAVFNADSAYAFTAQQVAFGPRIPGSKAHKACAVWIITKLKQYGATVIEQNFTANIYDGRNLPSKNIIGSINPTATKRILLTAHWDTRWVADKDSVNKDKPLDGASDGASGAAVMLEIARSIHAEALKPNVGIDFIFFDAEDYGETDDFPGNHDPKSWCLGSQYWAKNKHIANYSAYYGILFDMVGAKGAEFPFEMGSKMYASDVFTNVWHIGNRLGYSHYFLEQEGANITDDYVAVAETAKIPMIDILDFRVSNGQHDFGSYHHTHADNMSVIDKNTLKAVGQTTLQVLYQED